MKKTILKIIAGIGVVMLLALAYFYSQFEPSENHEWGITFSHSHVEYLGFEWRTVYLDMLNDLQPQKLRLMSYWENIEPERGKFDYQVVDEMLIEAGKRNIEVILVVGHKQPRWPECHHPTWYAELSEHEQEHALMTMLTEAVNHFKQFDAVKIWQVENEPLFDFGHDCPAMSKDLLQEEIELVRSLDDRPILVTDSGELGRWLPTASVGADLFGTTMYRVVHNPTTGYFRYPLPPLWFRLKAGILNTFHKPQEILGVELQAEPWFADNMFLYSMEDQNALMNAKIFAQNIEYAKSAGFQNNYLWGEPFCAFRLRYGI